MLPGFAVADMSNGTGVHSEAARYRAGRFATGNIGADLANHFFRKLGLRTCASAFGRTEIRDGANDTTPPFSSHVVVIGLHRAERQMARVDANRVVARVHNNNRLPFGQRASVMVLIDKTMSQHFRRCAAWAKKAISLIVLVGLPFPARVWFANFYFGPKAIVNHTQHMGKRRAYAIGVP